MGLVRARDDSCNNAIGSLAFSVELGSTLHVPHVNELFSAGER